MALEFKGKLRMAGVFTTFTGLSIGKDKIGSGNSNIPRMIVRHPISAIPFIPASSFRGAVRRILERKYYPAGDKCRPLHICKNPEEYSKCQICNIFGLSSRDLPQQIPGRSIFRDIYPTKESTQSMQNRYYQGYLSETKLYVSIDRVTSQGDSYGIEQIPRGVHFEFEVFFTIYRNEDISYFATLLEGLQMLESAFLGAYGSRGLGKIKFGQWPVDSHGSIGADRTSGPSVNWRPKNCYETGTNEQMLIRSEENLGIEDIIAQYNKRIAAAIE